jgi:hypothetical protein
MTDEIIIGGDSVDIPNGTYPAKLARIETKPSAKFDNDFRAWTFKLDNGSVAGGSSSLMTGKKSKGGKWIAALLGRQPKEGENVTAELIGKPCLVVVEEDDNGWPKVTNVLPPMTAAQPATAQPVAVSQTTISEDIPF